MIWRQWTVLALVVAILISGLMWSDGVVASGHSGVRTFSSPWTAPGGQITVSIKVRDYGPFGMVQETLPEGFRYLDSGLP